MIQRAFLWRLIPGLLVSPCFGQVTLFEEDFDEGTPSNWAHLQLGWSSDFWMQGTSQVDGTPDTYREGFCDFGFSWRDNTLVSPAIDLRSFTKVDFFCDQYQPNPLSIDCNAIEIPIDGGASFTTVLDLAGTSMGISVVTASLDAFIGLPDVKVALHYTGFVSNDWSLESVRVTTPKLPFEAIPPAISLSSGGAQSFALGAGPQYGSELYPGFATASGTSTGLSHSGVPIALNCGGITRLSLAGVVLNHLFGVFDLSQFGTLVFASNPRSVELVP